MVQAVGAEFRSSVPTATTTMRSALAAPIEAPEYVAIFDEADTPAGFAVWVIAAAIL